MSSYLNNLVLRNQQAGEVVRPRLPSIFEPPAALPFMSSALDRVAPLEGDQPRDQSDEPEALTTRRAREPLMPPQSQPRTPDPATPAPAIPAWRGLQVIAEAQRISLPPMAEAEGAHEPSAQTSSDQSAHLSNASNAAERGGRVPTADVMPGIEEKTSDRHQPEREVRHRSQPHAPALAAHAKPQGVTPSFTDAAGKQAAAAEPFTEMSDRRTLVRPRVSPLRQPADESGNDHSDDSRSRREQVVPRPLAPQRREQITSQAAEPPRPTINVTIGRIEVKALPPAAAPPQRKPPPSLMSLDEYMRRRNSGGDSR